MGGQSLPRLTRILWTLLALAFLAVSWLWDALAPLVRAVLMHIPLEGLKRAVIRFMDRLQPYPTLFVFLIPIVVIEPFKIRSLWLLAKGEILVGLFVSGAAEILRFGLVAFLFKTCKDKLLSIPWFAKAYALFVAAHDWAHRQVEPLRRWIRDALLEAGLQPGQGSFVRRVRALWRHARRRSSAGA